MTLSTITQVSSEYRSRPLGAIPREVTLLAALEARRVRTGRFALALLLASTLSLVRLPFAFVFPVLPAISCHAWKLRNVEHALSSHIPLL